MAIGLGAAVSGRGLVLASAAAALFTNSLSRCGLAAVDVLPRHLQEGSRWRTLPDLASVSGARRRAQRQMCSGRDEGALLGGGLTFCGYHKPGASTGLTSSSKDDWGLPAHFAD